MMELKESGFSLSLSPTSTWTKKGQSYQHCVLPCRRSEGKIKLIGTLRWDYSGEQLEYTMLEGLCRGVEIIAYLDALAKKAVEASRETVVVMDNTPSHTAVVVRERKQVWQQMGLRVYRLPSYCPNLNLIERVWRRLKYFLMPRRFYDSKSELRDAALQLLRLFGVVEVHC